MWNSIVCQLNMIVMENLLLYYQMLLRLYQNITRVYLSPKEFDWLRKNRSDLTYMHKVNCSNYMHIWLFDCCIFTHVLNRSRMDCWWWMMVNIFFLLVRCLRTSRNTFCVRLLHNTYDRHERMKHCCIFINTN